jgi:hypothetical protein
MGSGAAADAAAALSDAAHACGGVEAALARASPRWLAEGTIGKGAYGVVWCVCARGRAVATVAGRIRARELGSGVRRPTAACARAGATAPARAPHRRAAARAARRRRRSGGMRVAKARAAAAARAKPHAAGEHTHMRAPAVCSRRGATCRAAAPPRPTALRAPPPPQPPRARAATRRPRTPCRARSAPRHRPVSVQASVQATAR